MSARIWAFLDWCFFGPASRRQGPAAQLLRIVRYPYAVSRDLWHGEIALRAMGLVYTTLLSLIPLLAFSFAILKVFGARHDLQPLVYEFFAPMGAVAAAELTDKVLQFAARVSSGIVGSVGLVVLAWTLVGTIKKVEDSFNFLWRVEQPRSFARRIVEYLTLIVVGPLLLVAFVGLTHATLASGPVQTVARLPVLDRLPALVLALAPYAMVTTFFTGMYTFVPNTRVRWKSALIGALAGGVLWAAVGKLFTTFVLYSTRLTVVYAGFAIIVAALVWTYLGWLILLAGAQLSFYVQNPAYLRLGLQELRLSCVELEQLALKMMYLVARSYLAGGPRWTVNRLAEELGLPAIAVAKMATALERHGLLLVTDEDQLSCARDLSRIGINDILELARNQRSGHTPPRELPLPPVDRLLASLDELRRNRCEDLTLRDLAEDGPRPVGRPGAIVPRSSFHQ